MNSLPPVVARVLAPIGFYPRASIQVTDAAYVADEELSFIVHHPTVDTRGGFGPDETYSETQWLNPAEVRLLGSIMLAVDTEEGRATFYPFFHSEAPEGLAHGSGLESLRRTIKPLLVNQLSAPPRQLVVRGRSLTISNPYKSTGIPMPPIAGGEPYTFRDQIDLDLDLVRLIHSNVSLKDHLYIRALSALIKASMLARHYQFFEEAILVTFIVMDICFNLVRRRLIVEGVQNPTSVEAMSYVLRVFDSPANRGRVESWFEEYYDRRVMSFHPDSRFGQVPHAPLLADDYWHLTCDLIEILRYLICGYIPPQYTRESSW